MSEPCAHERADAIREHGALRAAHLEIARLEAELVAVRSSLADTASSLLASVKATVGYQHQRDLDRAALARVDAVCRAAWDVQTPLASKALIANIRAALKGRS